MAGKDLPSSIGTASPTEIAFPWRAIHEINERCFELLMQIARSDANSLMLRPTLLNLLRQSTPEARKRAAARTFLLVDLELRNVAWWKAVHTSPDKQFPRCMRRNTFPRRSALPLARSLLMASREAIRADFGIACLMLGVDPLVADLISDLQITQIDRIAARQFQHLEPRWLQHPAIWQSLIRFSDLEGTRTARCDAHCIQILLGSLLLNR